LAVNPTILAQESAAETHQILGKVTQPDGTAAANALVWIRAERFAHHPRNENDERDPWQAPQSTRTTDQGFFLFERSDDAPFALLIDHTPFAIWSSDEPLEIGAALEIQLRPAEPLVGHVNDSEQSPVAAVTVIHCTPRAQRFGEVGCSSTESDENGRFNLDRAAAGLAKLQGYRTGYALSEIRDVELPLPEAAPAIELQLYPGADLSGTVVDDVGHAEPGARVFFRPAAFSMSNASRTGRAQPQPLIARYSDEQGKFHLNGLPAAISIQVHGAQGLLRRASSDSLQLNGSERRTDFELIINRLASIRVKLVDGDERPVKGLTATFQADTSGINFSTDKAYVVADEIEAGRFTLQTTDFTERGLTLLPEGYAEIKLDEIKPQPGATVDLGTLVVSAGERIAGKVVDDLGEPIAEAKIEAMYLEGTSARARSTSSQSDGRFSLAGLGEGNLMRVTISAEGHADELLSNVPIDQTEMLIALPRHGSVIGRVLAADGSPLMKMSATLEGVGSHRRGTTTEVWGDEDGTFKIDNAPSGTHTLQLRAAGMRSLLVEEIVVNSAEETDSGSHELEPGLKLSGTVVEEGSGQPMADAVVVAQPTSGWRGLSQPFDRQVTDDSGRFTLQGLSPGAIRVVADHPLYAQGEAEVELEDGAPADEVTLKLARGGSIRGVVLDRDGQPSGSRTVSISSGGGLTAMDGMARTDSAGTFHFGKLKPASYRVMLLPEGGGGLGGLKQKTAVVQDGQETVVNFDDSAAITFEGRILRNGQPIAEVMVVMLPAGGVPSVTSAKTSQTDLEGRFTVGLEQPGNYSVMVQDIAQGGTAGRAEVQIPDEPLVLRDIPLSSAAVRGQVNDSKGAPLDQAQVTMILVGATTTDWGAMGGAVSDENGRYEVSGLKPGIYTISAVAEGYQTDSRELTVDEERTVDGIDFQLKLAEALSGRVVDASGKPVAGALVAVTDAGATGFGSNPVESSAAGQFSIDLPGDGPVDIYVMAAGFAPTKLGGFVYAAGDAAAAPTITLERGSRLRVLVLNGDGSPAVGVRVTLEAVEPSPLSLIASIFSPPAATDAIGQSLHSNLAPGGYKLYSPDYPQLAPKLVEVGTAPEGVATLQLP
jgi:protocatechuate 3,4-dioxygenase beta subunit